MSVIGVDPSVDHPALALWPARETWQLKIEGQGVERLDNLFCQIRGWCAALSLDQLADLQAVFIERPTGQFPNPSLAQANGVIQVAIRRGLAGYFAHPVSVFEVSPGTWKKEAIGLGRAKKDDVYEWADYEVFPAPPNKREGTRAPLTQDECDALAIACAGYKLVSEEREEG